MLSISEWLPNPAGADANKEWIELHNDGANAASISGWRLVTSSGKASYLKGSIGPGEYLVLSKSATGLTLKNSGEKLTLFSPSGNIADETSYAGSAREGLSVNHSGAASYFAAPTPGAPNTSFRAEISSAPYIPGMPLSSLPGAWKFPVMMFSSALALSVFAVYILKSNAFTNELFFSGN